MERRSSKSSCEEFPLHASITEPMEWRQIYLGLPQQIFILKIFQDRLCRKPKFTCYQVYVIDHQECTQNQTRVEKGLNCKNISDLKPSFSTLMNLVYLTMFSKRSGNLWVIKNDLIPTKIITEQRVGRGVDKRFIIVRERGTYCFPWSGPVSIQTLP